MKIYEIVNACANAAFACDVQRFIDSSSCKLESNLNVMFIPAGSIRPLQIGYTISVQN